MLSIRRVRPRNAINCFEVRWECCQLVVREGNNAINWLSKKRKCYQFGFRRFVEMLSVGLLVLEFAINGACNTVKMLSIEVLEVWECYQFGETKCYQHLKMLSIALFERENAIKRVSGKGEMLSIM